MSAADALAAFVDRYVAAFPRLLEPYDADWRSPCECEQPFEANGERWVPWQPCRRAPAADFDGLEHALELQLHPAIKSYFGAFWSGNLEAEARDGHVSLILLWNPDDVDRLVENLIGHALAKQRARQPFTVFFACTEADSELFLSVANDTGEVLLEQPGRKPLRSVAPTLEEFLLGLKPAPPVHQLSAVGQQR